MGETLAETRIEVEALRAENQQTATELEARVRHALDLKARLRENPLPFLGVGAAAVFLVAGGPKRLARLIRRRVRPSNAEQAYDALPKPMQAWVDTLVAEVGPKADSARAALTEELQRWRSAPMKDKKARKELAKAMVEGPPGPSRTAWKAAEAALTLLSAALARRAIEQFLIGEGRRTPPPPKEATTAAAKGDATKVGEEYS
ncbi:MAG TPA: hypothetical protein VHU77_12020, partial [Candidatus Limnocylindria bacterium]|nr:hypothetical protein [Candidatus Limnocylindria bacterium]